jgi:hypothetical protein
LAKVGKPSRRKLLDDLEDAVVSYFQSQQAVEREKKNMLELREDIESIFNSLHVDSIDITAGDTTIRAQRFNSNTIIYDVEALMPLLKEKKLRSKVLKPVIDSRALEAAFNLGQITLQEVKEANGYSVRTSTTFKVGRIKG